jgi:hypothetical protein
MSAVTTSSYCSSRVCKPVNFVTAAPPSERGDLCNHALQLQLAMSGGARPSELSQQARCPLL